MYFGYSEQYYRNMTNFAEEHGRIIVQAGSNKINVVIYVKVQDNKLYEWKNKDLEDIHITQEGTNNMYSVLQMSIIWLYSN